MNGGDIINFDASKNFTYIKPLGNGGTGDTHLFKDETTDIHFAIKKYVPKQVEYVDEFYNRFVDEIKILFNISHPNIVRIYNYYLYPESKTGYLQMEYVRGTTIDEYVELPWTKSWDEIFVDVISAFEYLEDNNILHRDIRPGNILIDDNSNVKIIDFGFGKILEKSDDQQNSILLNWPATEMPNEIVSKNDYTEQTEIYFVGTLFRHVLKDELVSFKYNHIIEKMVKVSTEDRYQSFHEIKNDINEGVLSEIGFSENEKDCYISFADDLTNCIIEFYDKYKPITDYSIILSKLSELIRVSSLETYIQDNSALISCFVLNGFRYKSVESVLVEHIVNFYKFIIGLTSNKRKIVFDNIFTRLSNIGIRFEDKEDDLPF
jgi:serine/threonine-protein kinase